MCVKNRNEDIKNKVKVTFVVNKMREARLKCFRHVKRKCVDALVRKCKRLIIKDMRRDKDGQKKHSGW